MLWNWYKTIEKSTALATEDFRNLKLLLNIFLSSVFVIHLLLASCWLRCVLLAQFAISVSASFRIRSDFVLDECALERIKGSKKYSFPSTNGRCPEWGHFVITLTHSMTNGPLGIYYPFTSFAKTMFQRGDFCLVFAESDPPFWFWKNSPCIEITIFNILSLNGCENASLWSFADTLV